MILYLASSSPRRRALLKKARIRFKVLKPAYHETNDTRVSVRVLVKRHAFGKALSVAKRVRNGLVLGADTIVVRQGSLSGKPRSIKHAKRMLGSLQGKWHTVLTGVALLKLREGQVEKKQVFAESTDVKLKKMTPTEIGRYLARIGPLDKAGAYAIQSAAINIVEAVRGSLDNAVGLPIEKLKNQLRMLN